MAVHLDQLRVRVRARARVRVRVRARIRVRVRARVRVRVPTRRTCHLAPPTSFLNWATLGSLAMGKEYDMPPTLLAIPSTFRVWVGAGVGVGVRVLGSGFGLGLG